VRDVKVGSIVQANQLDIHKQLNKNKYKKKKYRRRDSNQEHLSFSDIDKMIRQRADVDESKCQGR
jgi:hypothetical protein